LLCLCGREIDAANYCMAESRRNREDGSGEGKAEEERAAQRNLEPAEADPCVRRPPSRKTVWLGRPLRVPDMPPHHPQGAQTLVPLNGATPCGSAYLYRSRSATLLPLLHRSSPAFFPLPCSAACSVLPLLYYRLLRLLCFARLSSALLRLLCLYLQYKITCLLLLRYMSWRRLTSPRA
jgi:hypothetical protein